MSLITEEQVELQSIEWFKELGYQYKDGYDIAPEGENPERDDFTDEDNFNEIIPPLILSDYGFCLAFYDFLQEEIDKSPDDLESLREEKIR